MLLSSAMATLGGAGEYVMYAASKGAVESLSIGLARELAAEGIRVNVVEPGPTDTGIHPPGRLERLSKVVPLGRPGTPEEIAEAVMFLLSERSSFTTGRGAAGRGRPVKFGDVSRAPVMRRAQSAINSVLKTGLKRNTSCVQLNICGCPHDVRFAVSE